MRRVGAGAGMLQRCSSTSGNSNRLFSSTFAMAVYLLLVISTISTSHAFGHYPLLTSRPSIPSTSFSPKLLNYAKPPSLLDNEEKVLVSLDVDKEDDEEEEREEEDVDSENHVLPENKIRIPDETDSALQTRRQWLQ